MNTGEEFEIIPITTAIIEKLRHKDGDIFICKRVGDYEGKTQRI